jgi:hypothetical protein
MQVRRACCSLLEVVAFVWIQFSARFYIIVTMDQYACTYLTDILGRGT